MLNNEKAVTHKNEPYHWFVIHTDDQRYLKRVLYGREGIEEIYLPMEHIECKDSNKLKAKVLLTTYIFVHAMESCIRGELKVFDAQLELDSRRKYLQPMIISDEDMDVFKTICENYLDIERLRNPYASFFNNDRARILVGPFAGFEGFIKEIKGDLKLITQLGDWAVAISNIQKYDIEIISNRSSHSTEAARLVRLSDYFREILLGYDVYDYFRPSKVGRIRVFDKDVNTQLKKHLAKNRLEASRILRKLIFGMYRYLTKAQLLKFLRSIRDDSSNDNKVMIEFLESITVNDEALLMQMAQYIYSKDSKAVLEEAVYSAAFRPFLTITAGAVMPEDNSPMIVRDANLNCDEWICPVQMSEGEYDVKTGKTVIKDNTYFAHVAVIPNNTYTLKVMSNWGNFFKRYRLMQDDEQIAFLEKLKKYGLNVFYEVLSDTSDYEVLDSSIGTGLGIIISKDANVEKTVNDLIFKSIALIKEIMASTRLRPWQKRLCEVWIKR